MERYSVLIFFLFSSFGTSEVEDPFYMGESSSHAVVDSVEVRNSINEIFEKSRLANLSIRISFKQGAEEYVGKIIYKEQKARTLFDEIFHENTKWISPDDVPFSGVFLQGEFLSSENSVSLKFSVHYSGGVIGFFEYGRMESPVFISDERFVEFLYREMEENFPKLLELKNEEFFRHRETSILDSLLPIARDVRRGAGHEILQK